MKPLDAHRFMVLDIRAKQESLKREIAELAAAEQYHAKQIVALESLERDNEVTESDRRREERA